ncbi:ATPase involved in chromosome partitioning [Schinkia azotoformans MEV2011]|uniref:ATPase involved in chromosome partitioning n=1 Tax=Schinkia azotoformans MEV2011 TaxID=1348973 RepID=A0A072NQX1_SCHAZ|nr:MinD/ParA family protein [Schinkia azotoformans]KEF39896.1 ATPase involved in chromosome partitioning [Schinkia azotoformans MEV2011]MEC1697195.1 MinD/ParA family protein [Schinkia azotoformans]MEC1715272.1 MinD/ParA family protein [Schinkia azotoformans]MEC1724234.1 MinD/ParA family protein [Schinkia azotoformans]MEC1740977.1 MinD/ParA family protein [Schinkia azotoformans]
MKDQAEKLRAKIELLQNKAKTKTIAVVSGKGGVGKSNFSLNFALGLSSAGSSVLLFDMDIGMGNIDILMGVTPNYTIVDMFESDLKLTDIIEKGTNNLSYIAAGTGLSKIFKLDNNKFELFITQLEEIIEDFEYIIFDMGAGITEESMQFILSVNELFVIATPEPTSITDAYAVMKYIHLKELDMPFYLIVNRTYSEKQALSTSNRLSNAVKQFLNKDVVTLGDLPDDRVVLKAVSHQMPFLLYAPNSDVSRSMLKIVERYTNQNFDEMKSTSSYSFISKLRRYFIK